MPFMKLKQFGQAYAPKGSFRANLITLMTGTAIAQMIMVAISPVLTRLFAPEAFGALGVYLSLLAISGAVVTLRYDQALMLPKNSEVAAALFWSSILSVAAISGFIFLGCVLFFKQIISILKLRDLSIVIFLLPVSLFFFGIYVTLNSWSTRQKKFGRSSISQVVRSLSIAAVQIFSGILKTGPMGLIGGALAGDFLAALTLGRLVKRDDWPILKRSFCLDKIKNVARQYRDFPLFSSTQNLLNAISQNIPLLLLAKFFGPAVAGFYVLGVRGIQIPMNFFLTSLRQVFFQRASELHNQGGDTYALFKRTTLQLLAMVAVPALTIILFGPRIFAFVLGRKWVIAGEYARWLILWLMLMFANVPAVLFAQICRKQKAVLIQDICLLIFRVLAIVIGGRRGNPLLAVVLYSLVGVFFNLFIIFWVGNFLRKSKGAQG
ncbi:MAG: oligosaccharide flippase family protein [Candidatus Aminicenantes bacterium]|nr:oligosaccharide flippase family protein [Candidatus Aminicenantes bacterium]